METCDVKISLLREGFDHSKIIMINVMLNWNISYYSKNIHYLSSFTSYKQIKAMQQQDQHQPQQMLGHVCNRDIIMQQIESVKDKYKTNYT